MPEKLWDHECAHCGVVHASAAAEFQCIFEGMGFTADEAKVVRNRVADRLDGITHDEAVRLNPMPEGSEHA